LGGNRYYDGRQWTTPSIVFAEPEEHPQLPFEAALGALVVLTVSLIAGKLIVESLLRFDWPLLVYIVLLTIFGYGPSILWGWYVRRRWGAGRLSAIGWSFRWRDAGFGPLTWLCAIICQVVMMLIVTGLNIPLTSNVESIDGDVGRSYVIATAIAAVIAAPIIEEVVFRGLVMRGFLSRMGAVPAVVLQGVLFGAAHVDPARGAGNIGLVMVLSSVGIAFGGAAYLTRRLGPTVIAHAIFNGLVLLVLLTGWADNLR
jgi:membrane protease YdiL (CAAX protease family)